MPNLKPFFLFHVFVTLAVLGVTIITPAAGQEYYWPFPISYDAYDEPYYQSDGECEVMTRLLFNLGLPFT